MLVLPSLLSTIGRVKCLPWELVAVVEANVTRVVGLFLLLLSFSFALFSWGVLGDSMIESMVVEDTPHAIELVLAKRTWKGPRKS